MPGELQCARDLKKVLYIPQLLCNFWYALINPFLPSPNLHLIGQPSACSLCIWLFCLFLHFVLLIPHIGIFWCGLRPTVSVVFWMQWTNSHGLLKSCGEKGWHGHSLSERVPQPLPGQAFIAFSGSKTSRKVLIHYAQVCFRWLPFTDNKEKDVANPREKVVELVSLHPWEV